MEMKEVKDLIREVLQSDISEFELEHTGTRLKLKRIFAKEQPGISHLPGQPSSPGFSIRHASIPENATNQGEESEDSGLHVVTSPIVGTFYRSSSPGAEPYVQLGSQVSDGSTLCIVEAMKLMNEIPSDISGEVVRIYVENGNPVEFGQKLFAIRPQNQG